ncbi:1-deoxy-D-xylulose-5-phosphate synthase [Amycolatopsis dendrobii]|uniref:1-deoxy-D-xylulose-5-phosphate synthase n=1 Tax=Amycolatopsis dendrobii TaxID=2760662 RepID=A0A7W3W4M0_9PSEU|nr:1-deoxy-D-xylulose-5-phosphate synthase [Amycolatopsis dendrobii]MBB1158192.1 1-deoxy-D-xylulose-5-phosphate synthase [Amycolatopsis dendrobii]
MALLERIRGPRDLDGLSGTELGALAGEIREFLVSAVARTGGHLGPNLGVVELTLALHRVFDSPCDTLLWDVGHQCYVHKMLTGRQDGFAGLRAEGGLSGYPSRRESGHDVIENSHASAALSWADGLARAYEVRHIADRAVVAVVGDGALTGGMAWEALNNIAGAQRPVVVVLNDNGRAYDPTVGGLGRHLAALRRGPGDGGVFSALGMDYLGPVDGHDIAATETALREARGRNRPVVVHCVTRKGAGYAPSEKDPVDRHHAIGPFDPGTGAAPASPPSWTSVFSDEMIKVGNEREDVVAVTAAMRGPTGLAPFAEQYPGRCFDVGIAEQHAAAAAAGLAYGGLHPVVAVYATFLNRCFDQVLMDVALHGAGATFVLDRAGVTGDDGASHNGMWDLTLLQAVPGLRVAAPRDAAQLRTQLREAIEVADAPTVVRFPKGAVGPDIEAIERHGPVDVLSRGVREDVLVVGIGPLAGPAVEAGARLAELGIGATVADPRWIQPVPEALVALARAHRAVVVAADCGRAGGPGTLLAQALQDAGSDVPVTGLGIPQQFLEPAKRTRLLTALGLTADAIVEACRRTVEKGLSE